MISKEYFKHEWVRMFTLYLKRKQVCTLAAKNLIHEASATHNNDLHTEPGFLHCTLLDIILFVIHFLFSL